jgi:hypothetical protein
MLWQEDRSRPQSSTLEGGEVNPQCPEWFHSGRDATIPTAGKPRYIGDNPERKAERKDTSQDLHDLMMLRKWRPDPRSEGDGFENFSQPPGPCVDPSCPRP